MHNALRKAVDYPETQQVPLPPDAYIQLPISQLYIQLVTTVHRFASLFTEPNLQCARGFPLSSEIILTELHLVFCSTIEGLVLFRQPPLRSQCRGSARASPSYLVCVRFLSFDIHAHPFTYSPSPVGTLPPAPTISPPQHTPHPAQSIEAVDPNQPALHHASSNPVKTEAGQVR